jgi:hypothetical protein
MRLSAVVASAVLPRVSSLSQPLVFYIGLQKAGTTSFNALAGKLQLRTTHCPACLYVALRFDAGNCVNTSGVGAREPHWEPDYHQTLIELGWSLRPRSIRRTVRLRVVYRSALAFALPVGCQPLAQVSLSYGIGTALIGRGASSIILETRSTGG